METIRERISFCRFLHMLVKEEEISISFLAQRTGRSPEEITDLLEGKVPPTLDELIIIGNVLGRKLTFQQTVPFAHQKIVNTMEKC